MEKIISKVSVKLSSGVRFARIKASSSRYDGVSEFRSVVGISPKVGTSRTSIEVVLQNAEDSELITLPYLDLELSSEAYRLTKSRFGLEKGQVFISIISPDSPYTTLYYSLDGTLLFKYELFDSLTVGKPKFTRYYKSWRDIFKFFKTRKGW